MLRDRGPRLAARLRHALFVSCIACTLWLIVQNSILLVLVPAALRTGHLRVDFARSTVAAAAQRTPRGAP